MSSSTRGPQRGTDRPFVMHLEWVCRLVDMGARLGVIEFNPNSDLGKVRDTLVKDVVLRICDGGGVALQMLNGVSISAFGLTLANYKKVWRVWQNGVHTEAMRRSVRWG